MLCKQFIIHFMCERYFSWVNDIIRLHKVYKQVNFKMLSIPIDKFT